MVVEDEMVVHLVNITWLGSDMGWMWETAISVAMYKSDFALEGVPRGCPVLVHFRVQKATLMLRT